MTGHELQYIYNTASAGFNIPISDFSSTRKIEFKLAYRQLGYNHIIKAGGDYGDFVIRYWQSRFDVYLSQMSGIIPNPQPAANEDIVVVWDSVGGKCIFNGIEYETTGNPTPNGNNIIIGNNWLLTYYYLRLFDSNNNLLHDYVPWDNNGTIGIMDKVTNTFYAPSTGSYIAGPLAHIFESNKASLRFEASGGTNTLEITAETGWTCTTPTAFTMSTTTGGTGTTTITVTAPANTGATKIEETITFTDADNYTFNVKLRQKVDGAGYSYLQIGEDTIDTFYIGDLQIEALYMGEEQIYGSGPFVGLKATKTLSFNPNQLTGTLKIKSSENWSLTDNSTVGSYYTLENYTYGCDGWVPTYDGSLDGGELGEYGLWFEWQYGVSEETFQEYLDNLAEYGITATGSYCSEARYSVYLNPHSTGGPGWLSYSQTTGGTGETIVTVTASTAQAARTATITTSSANYTATTSVNQIRYYKPAYNEIYYTTIDGNAIGSGYNQGEHVVSITYGDDYGVITFDGVPYLNGLYAGGHFGGTGSVTRWWLPEQITSTLAYMNFEWQDYVVEMFCYMTSNVPYSIFQSVQETTPAIMHIPVGASSAYTNSGIYAANKSNWTVVEDL